MVVGDKIPSPDNLPGGGVLPVARDSLQAPIINLDDAEAILNEAADTIENALDLVDLGGDVGQGNNDLSNWAKFVKNYGFVSSGKEVEPKDWLSAAATGIRGMGSVIAECTKGPCDPKKVVDAIGGAVLAVALSIAAALPVLGAVLVAVGAIMQVVAMFLPAARVSQLPTITAYDIQNIVENAISKYSVAMTASELDAIRVFADIDVDNINGVIDQLGYMKAHPVSLDNATNQAYLNRQVEYWFRDWEATWDSYQDAIRTLETTFIDKMGRDSNSLRIKLTNWDASCTSSCQLREDNKILITDGNNLLTRCDDAAKAAADDYNGMMRFATAWITTAFKLFNVMGSVMGVLKVG